MSINFSTLKGLTIPEGNVVEIKDASGRVLWVVSGGKVILEVEKITADTYAGETTYTGENFIVLNIYPKTNGTVKVTYGGLTKTITDTSGAEEPNAQQVFFGTFNGASDEVETPASGELTIDGDCYAFAVGTYKTYNSSSSKTVTNYCSCITDIVEFGAPIKIPDYAFYSCDGLTNVVIPDGVTSIGDYAFMLCHGLTNVVIPDGVTSIGDYAFSNCSGLISVNLPDSASSLGSAMFVSCAFASIDLPDNLTSIPNNTFMSCVNLTSIVVPNSVTSIGKNAFSSCTNLESITFENPNGWYYTATEGGDISTGYEVNVTANNFVYTWQEYYADGYLYRS